MSERPMFSVTEQLFLVSQSERFLQPVTIQFSEIRSKLLRLSGFVFPMCFWVTGITRKHRIHDLNFNRVRAKSNSIYPKINIGLPPQKTNNKTKKCWIKFKKKHGLKCSFNQSIGFAVSYTKHNFQPVTRIINLENTCVTIDAAAQFLFG